MSITTSIKARAQAGILAQLQGLIMGLQDDLPGATFTLASTAYTTPTLVTVLQENVATLTAVTAAHAALKVALAAYAAQEAKTAPVIMGLRRTLEAMYVNAPDKLVRFGMEARKTPAPRTTEQLAVSAVKAAATRKARGTRSKKQNAAIKGNVTGIEIVPVTAPAGQVGQ